MINPTAINPQTSTPHEVAEDRDWIWGRAECLYVRWKSLMSLETAQKTYYKPCHTVDYHTSIYQKLKWTLAQKQQNVLSQLLQGLSAAHLLGLETGFHSSPICMGRRQLKTILETAAYQMLKTPYQLLRWCQGTPLPSTAQTGKTALEVDAWYD